MDKTDTRIPVISDPEELNMPWRTLQTIIAGKSLIDTFELNIHDIDDAHKFLSAYGLQNSDDAEALRSNALEYIETVLLENTRLRLPEKATRLSVPELMVEASAASRSGLSEWCCVILKVCHAVAHAQWSRDEDAYNAALIKINTRLKPFIIESQDGTWIGDEGCRIPIVEYSIKTQKKFFRVVTKLLLKEGNLSARIFDHIGIRIVTNDIFSAILLIKFLRSRHIFMYANVLPQESKNSIAEFHQIEALFAEFSDPIQHAIMGKSSSRKPARNNPFSSKTFKMIKIVERILVTTQSGRNAFFPCEFQLLTKQTFESLSKNWVSHSDYEKRQVKGVRNRLFKGTQLV